jgi:PGF-CTERM protein
MSRNTTAAVGIALFVCLVVLGVGLAPQASAGHGSDANYTVQPVDAPDDRKPGISDASYKQFATGNESIQYMDYFVVSWDAGDLSGCSASNTEKLGIDRGGNNSGTKTDEGLLQYVKDQQRSANRVLVEFYNEDDIAGETTYVNESDEIVSYQTNCFGNPDEPGWYQISAKLNGTGWDGERKEVSATSHYFWICDCENESEAREQLGPPPSEEDGTADDSTPTQTDAGGGATTATQTDTADGVATPTDTPTDGGDGTETQTGTSEADSTPGATTTDDNSDVGEQTSGGTDDGQAGADNTTPTSEGGPGFTGIGAVLALLTTALLSHRRR